MNIESLKIDNKTFEIKNIMKDTREKLGKLKKRFFEKKEKKENREKEPETIKLKNYEIKNYGTHFSIDINNLYGLTIKKIEGEIVFDAKHEGFISKEYYELNDEEIIDNGNIDMINRYLKSQNLPLISDDKDIKTLNSLFEKIEQ